MSLIEYPNLEQRSDEWYATRCGIVTASVVGQLISTRHLGAEAYACPECEAEPDEPCRSKVKRGGEFGAIKTFHSARADLAATLRDDRTLIIEPARNDTARNLTRFLAAERITGFVEPTFISSDMWRGIEDEPRAVEKYSEHYAPVTTTGFMVRDDWGFKIGYSPDGLVGTEGAVEAKSRRQKVQLNTILADAVPADNMAQLQAGLLVSGRKWIDYISYCGGMPLYVKRVTPDQRWFDAIVQAVNVFETEAAQIVEKYTAATEGLPATERHVELEMVIA